MSLLAKHKLHKVKKKLSLKKTPAFSRSHLVAFVLVFAAIGGTLLYFALAATPTYIFGKNTIGASLNTGGGGYIDVTGPYSLSDTSSWYEADRLTGYLQQGSSSEAIRGIIYTDSNGSPINFVAISSEVTIPAGSASAWYDFNFPIPPKLDPAKKYWIGYWYSASSAKQYYDPVAGAARYAPASYSSTANPPATFGTGTASDGSFSLYAVGIPTTPPPPPPPANINLNPSAVDHTLPQSFWGVTYSAYYHQDQRVSQLFSNLATALKPEVFRMVTDLYASSLPPEGPIVPCAPTDLSCPTWPDVWELFTKMQQVSPYTKLHPVLYSSPQPPLPSTGSPYDINNYNTNPNDGRSPQGIISWIKKMQDTFGQDVITGLELYNEPGVSMSNWYDDGGNQIIWAATHTGIYYKAIQDAIAAGQIGNPVPVNGWSNSSGSSGNIADANGLANFLTNNLTSTTKNIDRISYHAYQDWADPQSYLNAIFYPTFSNAGPSTNNRCGTPDPSFKSGFFAATSQWRQMLDVAGGQNIGLDQTEQYSSWMCSDSTNNYQSALNDIAQMIAATNNQAKWNLQTYLYQVLTRQNLCDPSSWQTPANCSSLQPPDVPGSPNDGLILYDSRSGSPTRYQFISGNVRYYALKDMVGPFVHNYKRQISFSIDGGNNTPGSDHDNSVRAIQASAGLNADGSKMGIMVANIDLTNNENATFNLGANATGPITGVYMPNSQDWTDLPSITPITASGSSFTKTIGAGEAYLFEVPIGQVAPPEKPVNTSAPTISGTTQVGSTLTAANGSWTGPPDTYAYQWQGCDSAGAGCVNISGATNSTYNLTSTDVDKTIKVEVTASNTAGSTAATSSATAVITNPQPPATNLDISPKTVNHQVDGNLSESDWQVATPVSKTVYGSTTSTAAFAALWDNNYLYIGVKVKDSSLQKDSGANLWEDDAVEVYIDANNNGGTSYDSYDWQFIKGWNNASLFTAKGGTVTTSSNSLHAWATTSDGYSVELAIPWSDLGIGPSVLLGVPCITIYPSPCSPSANTKIGFDVAFDDDNNGGARDAQVVWAGTFNDYKDPSGFGDLTLTGTPPDTDTTSPTVSIATPANNTTVSGDQVTITAEATDNVAIRDVQLDIDDGAKGGQLALLTQSPYTYVWDTTAMGNGNYFLHATATDTAGNSSEATITVIINNTVQPNRDTTPPTVPSGLSQASLTDTTADIYWFAASDPEVAGQATSGLKGYNLYRNGNYLTTLMPDQLALRDTNLSPDTTYSYQVEAEDNVGNKSPKTTALSVTTAKAPATPLPTVNLSTSSTNLTAAGSVNLSWTSTNATACIASGDWSGDKATSGSQTVGLSTSSTYSLDCTNDTGSATSSVSVTLNNQPPPTPTPSPTTSTKRPKGDLNSDDKINVIDLSILLSGFNSRPAPNTGADVNGDGVVNVIDLSILLSNYGR